MYDLSRVTKEFKEICDAAGVPMAGQISLNGRLTTTLGRVKFVINKSTNRITNKSVEFSKKLLETATDECISDVIKHEAAHWIVNERTHEDHGHDAYFAKVCAEIGTSNSSPTTDVTLLTPAVSAFKYDVWCDTCKEMVAHYSRAGRVIKEINSCTCAKCHTRNLVVKQNW